MGEIDKLLNELELEIQKAKKAAFSSTDVVVNKAVLLGLITQIRSSFPVEMRDAAQIIQDRDSILKSAEDYANNTMNMAEDKAKKMIAESEIVKQAQFEAQQYFNSVVDQCDRMDYDARKHCYVLFDDVEERLKQLLQTVQESKENVRRSPAPNQNQPSA